MPAVRGVFEVTTPRFLPRMRLAAVERSSAAMLAREPYEIRTAGKWEDGALAG